jgi:hypothetical protein
VRHAKRAWSGSPLIEGNPGGDTEYIGEAQNAGHLRAGVIHDANLVRADFGHCVVPLG